MQELKDDPDFQEKLKEISKLGAEGLEKYIMICNIMNRGVSLVGIFSLLYALMFPGILAIIGCGILVYQAANMSVYFCFLRECLEELLEKADKR